MNSSLWPVIIITLLVAAWYAWRYYKLRRNLDRFASQIRAQNTNTEIKELENLSSSITSINTNFDTRYSILDAERARLATVLEQLTDGVLIADAHGIIQFANPAAGKLFQTSELTHRSVAEVIRHHQLVEAWRRCQQNISGNPSCSRFRPF